MARIKKSEDEGVNLDSLMDALTNVVGILIIVFILVQLNVAQAVKKILSELPDVTEVQLSELEVDAEKASKEAKYLEESWKEKEDPSKATYAQLLAAKEEAKRLEETQKKLNVNYIDVDSLKSKQIELEKAIADKETQEVALLEKIEQLEKAVDDTPVYVAKQSKVVRMPNPRPLPEDGKEYKFLIANNKITYINEAFYHDQAVEEIRALREKALFRSPPRDPYEGQLKAALGDNADIGRVWPAFEALSSHFQTYDIIKGLGELSKMGYKMDSRTIESFANLAGKHRRELSSIPEAIAAAEKKDYEGLKRLGIWVSGPANGKIKLALGEDHRVEINANNPKPGIREFMENLNDAKEIRWSYKERVILDGQRIVKYFEERTRLGDRTCVSILKGAPTSNRLRNEVSLREGGGEGPEDVKNPASTFQRAMRKIASEPKSYAWFYVKGDSFDMYLDARAYADEAKAAAGWEPYGADIFAQTLRGVEVARLEAPKPRKPAAAGAAKQIRSVGKTLD